MTPYLIVFSAFLVIYFTIEATSGRTGLSAGQRWLLLSPLLIFSVIYAGHIGTDADQYGIIFDAPAETSIEPGFAMLMTGAKSIGLNYIGFTRVLAIIQLILLASILKRMRDPLFFLLFYVSSFFLNFEFNAIRNSLALMIIGAIYVRLQRASVIALLSSSVIHYSSLITLGVQRLALSKHQKLAMGMVVGAAALFAGIWFNPGLLGDQFGALNVYQGYLGHEYDSKSVYPALLLKLAVVWLLYRNGGSRFYLVIYAVLVLLIHLISPIIARISDLALFLVLLDFCMRRRVQRHRSLAIGLTMLLVASALLIPWNDCQPGSIDNWCLSRPGQ